MPVYYFDAWNGDRIASDNKGVECADDQTVCSAAAQALLDLAREVVDGTRRWELALDVSDAEKKPVCRVSLQFESEQKGQASAELPAAPHGSGSGRAPHICHGSALTGPS